MAYIVTAYIVMARDVWLRASLTVITRELGQRVPCVLRCVFAYLSLDRSHAQCARARDPFARARARDVKVRVAFLDVLIDGLEHVVADLRVLLEESEVHLLKSLLEQAYQ